MKRDNLAGQRRRTILARAPETPRDYITQLEDMRFQVRSSNKEIFYEVDLLNTHCTCPDFPRIEFCKHIASVEHHFGVGKSSAPGNTSSLPSSQLSALLSNTKSGNAASNAPYQENGSASLISATNDIIALSQELLIRMPKPDDVSKKRDDVSNTVKSLHSVRTHLAAVLASATGDGPQLPEKEQIAPNQHSWPETAQRMGVKRGKKGRGKVDSAHTAQHIGEINRKRNRQHEDPYGAGEQSGKRAKPDARSTAANTRARAKEASPKPPPSSLPPHLPPRMTEPSPMPCYIAGPPLPQSQPVKPTSSTPLPASLPPSLPPCAPGPFPAHLPYYPPPFLSQPAPLPQFTQIPYYYPGTPLYYPPPPTR